MLVSADLFFFDMGLLVSSVARLDLVLVAFTEKIRLCCPPVVENHFTAGSLGGSRRFSLSWSSVEVP
jgi:hypothetical protein